MDRRSLLMMGALFPFRQLLPTPIRKDNSDMETVTPNSVFRNVVRISPAAFENVLKEGNKEILTENPATAYYNTCIERHIDPLFALAMFNHESSLGKYGVATITKSWGNTRYPVVGPVPPIGTTNGRSGVFPIWRTWLDGLKSTLDRFNDTRWVYSQRTTIIELFIYNGPVWAPASDGNAPLRYVSAVVDFMNAHRNLSGDTVIRFDNSKFSIAPPFAERWRALGELALPTLGYPTGAPHKAKIDGVYRLVQVFERAMLVAYPEPEVANTVWAVRCATHGETYSAAVDRTQV